MAAISNTLFTLLSPGDLVIDGGNTRFHDDVRRAAVTGLSGLVYRDSANGEKEAREDLRFALGEQWDQADLDILKNQKRPALTFNIIQPLVFLAIGYQRQSRSSIRAFPEGGEDQIKSEIATRLLKKVQQRTKVENKMSQQF